MTTQRKSEGGVPAGRSWRALVRRQFNGQPPGRSGPNRKVARAIVDIHASASARIWSPLYGLGYEDLRHLQRALGKWQRNDLCCALVRWSDAKPCGHLQM